MRSGATQFFAFLFVIVLALGASAAQDEKDKSANHSRFDQFKKLAGEWVSVASADGKPGSGVHVKYKVTSNGSAVVETMAPDTAMEMVTIIHRDGDDVELTYYCAVGNQPHMKAPDKGAGNTVAFKFTHASNMKSDKDMHMHNVTYTFVDKDNLKTEWTSYSDGKPAGTMVFVYKRKQ